VKTYLVSHDIYGTDVPLAIVQAKDKKAASDVFWSNMDDFCEAISLTHRAPALGREPVTYSEMGTKKPFIFIGAVP